MNVRSSFTFEIPAKIFSTPCPEENGERDSKEKQHVSIMASFVTAFREMYSTNQKETKDQSNSRFFVIYSPKSLVGPANKLPYQGGRKWESIESKMGFKHAQQFCFIGNHAQCPTCPLWALVFEGQKEESLFFWWQRSSSSNSEAPSAPQVFLLHFSSFVNCVTFQLQRKKCHHPIHTYCEELKSRLFRFGTIFSHWAWFILEYYYKSLHD